MQSRGNLKSILNAESRPRANGIANYLLNIQSPRHDANDTRVDLQKKKSKMLTGHLNNLVISDDMSSK